MLISFHLAKDCGHLSGGQAGMYALLVRNTHKLPDLMDDEINTSC